MMDETMLMAKEIRRLTIALALVVSGLSILLFQGHVKDIAAGIIIGALTGIIGFSMITRMSGNIELYSNPKGRGYASYVKRYAVYTLIFALAAWRGVNILALLLGMLVHKGAILMYVWIHRKED